MSIEQFIDNEVKANDVVLFMKGTPQFPMCGFSGQVVQILDTHRDPDHPRGHALLRQLRLVLAAMARRRRVAQGRLDAVSYTHLTLPTILRV